MENKCSETAKILIPWAQELKACCPVHANQMAMLSQAMGVPFSARRLDSGESCSMNNDLNDEQKEKNKHFT